MYAIIDDRGAQFTVREGDEILCDLQSDAEPGQSVTFEKILLVGNEGQTRLGKPYVDGVSVTGEILRDVKGPKVTAFRFKRRKNVRVKRGHRQPYTRVRITGIQG